MADLPSDFSFGHVVMSAVYAVGDTVDDVNDKPDAVPAVGTITFTPVLKQQISMVAPARMVLVQTVQCELDLVGRMVDATGADGVWLITGVYNVSFAIENAVIAGFQILVEDTHTLADPLDLTIAAPLVIPPPYVPVVDSSLYADTIAARDETIALANSYVVDGDVVGDNLILTRSGGGTIDAGNVRGAAGAAGAPGVSLLGKGAFWTALPQSAWVVPGDVGSHSGTYVGVNGRITLVAVDVGAPSNLHSIGCNITTGSGVGSTLDVGVWASGSDGRPTGLPIFTATVVSTATGNKITVLGSALPVDPGVRLWVGYLPLGWDGLGAFRRFLASTVGGGQSMEHHDLDSNAAIGASGNAIRFPGSLFVDGLTSINTNLTGATFISVNGRPSVAVRLERV